METHHHNEQAPVTHASASSTRAVLLAADAAGRQIVSVHAKLTYRLQLSGACVLADQQAPFLELTEDRGEDATLQELDIIPNKAGTDLIIMASAWAPRGKRAKRMVASIECGPVRRRMRVLGDRRCLYSGRGEITFSEPEPFQSIPLRYERAYGGCDPTVAVPPPQNLLDAMGPHPGIYPRNPAGRGYVVNKDRPHIDGLLLPNIEDPSHMLTPESLVTGAPESWWRQPLPWSCDWFDANWFPRCTYLGAVPDCLPDDEAQIEEVRRGYLPVGHCDRVRAAKLDEVIDHRFLDAATPGLVLPFMKGDEAILLKGMMPGGDFVVRLPGGRPRMEVRVGRKTIPIIPVPNRVVISTDEMGVYIVWHGAYAPPRPLAAKPHSHCDPPAGPELEGIDVFVGGKLISPLP